MTDIQAGALYRFAPGAMEALALETGVLGTVRFVPMAAEDNLRFDVRSTFRPAADASPAFLRDLPGTVLREVLRQTIRSWVGPFVEVAHPPQRFDPVKPRVPVSGKAYGHSEVESLVEASLDFWLTTGRFNDAFERRFAQHLGIRHALTVNSGSSANLLAISALCSPVLGDQALRPGDEVLTAAVGFPTTVNPILQNGLVPVFVDSDPDTYNVDAGALERAINQRTRAIIVAHTLGNPFDLDRVVGLAREHGLWLVEDCCDALGSTYAARVPPLLEGPGRPFAAGAPRLVGTFGHIATFSFYPAHHLTMGEGGAVITQSPALKKVLESLRDWGRDCWCPPGKDDTCGKRYGWTLGQLPPGYDHKYTYSNLGYNLKITDMQAAVGLAQLDRLEGFHAQRRANAERLREGLKTLESWLTLPKATERSDPSWFGFPLTVKPGSPRSRDDLVKSLLASGVQTRFLFGGNLVRQPYMQGQKFRVAGSLAVADRITEATFWVGTYPGLGREHIDHIIATMQSAFGA